MRPPGKIFRICQSQATVKIVPCGDGRSRRDDTKPLVVCREFLCNFKAAICGRIIANQHAKITVSLALQASERLPQKARPIVHWHANDYPRHSNIPFASKAVHVQHVAVARGIAGHGAGHVVQSGDGNRHSVGITFVPDQLFHPLHKRVL